MTLKLSGIRREVHKMNETIFGKDSFLCAGVRQGSELLQGNSSKESFLEK
jgi:hypothetical protein